MMSGDLSTPSMGSISPARYPIWSSCLTYNLIRDEYRMLPEYLCIPSTVSVCADVVIPPPPAPPGSLEHQVPQLWRSCQPTGRTGCGGRVSQGTLLEAPP